MNQMYGFEGEVKSKYSSKMVDLYTEVFNWLPLCHCIDNKILVSWERRGWGKEGESVLCYISIMLRQCYVASITRAVFSPPSPKLMLVNENRGSENRTNLTKTVAKMGTHIQTTKSSLYNWTIERTTGTGKRPNSFTNNQISGLLCDFDSMQMGLSILKVSIWKTDLSRNLWWYGSRCVKSG